MASGYGRAGGWEPDVPARSPGGGGAPPATPADRAAELRDDLAALEQEREALEDDRAVQDRQGPPPGPDELDDRARGLADWERAHGQAESARRAVAGGWWDEWLGWTRHGEAPGPATGEAEGVG
jgi:hypothetical protein